jgi:SRSO17 transposase
VAASAPPQGGWQRWVLLRRRMTAPTAVTAYITYAPAPTSLAEMVRVAGMRWTVEASLQSAQGEVGLEHYEVRSWTGWYRHLTLAMWAQACLAVVRAATGPAVTPHKGAHRGGMTSLARCKAPRGRQPA